MKSILEAQHLQTAGHDADSDSVLLVCHAAEEFLLDLMTRTVAGASVRWDAESVAEDPMFVKDAADVRAQINFLRASIVLSAADHHVLSRHTLV